MYTFFMQQQTNPLSSAPQLQDFKLPANVRATTNAAEAIQSAQFAVHAVPVQGSRAFLKSIKDQLPLSLPLISVSKGLEVRRAKKCRTPECDINPVPAWLLVLWLCVQHSGLRTVCPTLLTDLLLPTIHTFAA